MLIPAIQSQATQEIIPSQDAAKYTSQQLYDKQQYNFTKKGDASITNSNANMSFKKYVESIESMRANNLTSIEPPLFISKYIEMLHRDSFENDQPIISTHYAVFAETIKRKPLFCSYKNKNYTEKSSPMIQHSKFIKDKCAIKSSQVSYYSVEPHQRSHKYMLKMVNDGTNKAKSGNVSTKEILQNARMIMIKDRENGRFYLRNNNSKQLLVGMNKNHLNIQKINIKQKAKKAIISINYTKYRKKKEKANTIVQKDSEMSPQRNCSSSQGKGYHPPHYSDRMRSKVITKMTDDINDDDAQSEAQTKRRLSLTQIIQSKPNPFTSDDILNQLKKKATNKRTLINKKDISKKQKETIEYVPTKKPPLPRFSFLGKVKKIIKEEETIKLEKKPRPPQAILTEDCYMVRS